MVVRKDPVALVNAIRTEHTALERLIRYYLDEYADYGWDSFTNALCGCAAQLDALRIELKMATVKEDTI